MMTNREYLKITTVTCESLRESELFFFLKKKAISKQAHTFQNKRENKNKNKTYNRLFCQFCVWPQILLPEVCES